MRSPLGRSLRQIRCQADHRLGSSRMGNTGAVPRVYILIVHIASRRQRGLHDVEGAGTMRKQWGRRCWNSMETSRQRALVQTGTKKKWNGVKRNKLDKDWFFGFSKNAQIMTGPVLTSPRACHLQPDCGCDQSFSKTRYVFIYLLVLLCCVIQIAQVRIISLLVCIPHDSLKSHSCPHNNAATTTLHTIYQ